MSTLEQGNGSSDRQDEREGSETRGHRAQGGTKATGLSSGLEELGLLFL